MLLSIITVNLNNSFGLEKTIISVINQTYINFEYIVVDGESTDNSIEILKKYKKNISCLISEKDNGIYDAMNKGIRKASGKYLLFLNSGDYLQENNVLERVINFIESMDTQFDILYGNLVKFKNFKYEIDKGPAIENLSFNQFFIATINHPSSFIRLDLFKQIGLYSTNYKIVSDWIFFCKAMLADATIKYIDINISVFDCNGLSNNFEQRNAERNIAMSEMLPKSVITDYVKWKKMSLIIKNIDTINKYWITRVSFIVVRKFSNFLNK